MISRVLFLEDEYVSLSLNPVHFREALHFCARFGETRVAQWSLRRCHHM